MNGHENTGISPDARGQSSAPGSEPAESATTRPMTNYDIAHQDSTEAETDCDDARILTDGGMSPSDLGHDLTLFQLDLLVAASKMDKPSGQDVISYLVDNEKYDQINHGRLYPNLDELCDHGLVEKGVLDRRTNCYEITDSGRALAEYRSEWTDLDD